ncbi:MAG: hypothetical protein J6M44_16815, partial [Butyrivibrio sp.]|nr:hypothetical protein [Butyrivibrio sp.]
TGKGVMNIKYTPAYATTDIMVLRPKQEVKAMDYRTRSTMPRQFLMMLSDVPNYIPEEFKDVEDDGKWHASHLYGPMVKIAPVEEPIPQPEPGPDDTPDTTPGTPTTIDVTPVALAAAPGQVLGAVREEPVAGEAPAVLGASRARGTADETTAPFVRVLVMAAVASAALFLTRKREEEN